MPSCPKLFKKEWHQDLVRPAGLNTTAPGDAESSLDTLQKPVQSPRLAGRNMARHEATCFFPGHGQGSPRARTNLYTVKIKVRWCLISCGSWCLFKKRRISDLIWSNACFQAVWHYSHGSGIRHCLQLGMTSMQLLLSMPREAPFWRALSCQAAGRGMCYRCLFQQWEQQSSSWEWQKA